MTESTRAKNQGPSMHHREIMLEDGRYMIFYTFDGPVAPRPTETDEPSIAKNTDV